MHEEETEVQWSAQERTQHYTGFRTEILLETPISIEIFRIMWYYLFGSKTPIYPLSRIVFWNLENVN